MNRTQNILTSIILTLILVSITTVGIADAIPSEEWNKTYRYTICHSIPDCYLGSAISVQQTIDGGYILAGNMAGVDESLVVVYAGYILKTDSKGNKQWIKSFDDTIINSVRQTIDGGYILPGTMEIDPQDAQLIKTDSNGNILWVKSFGNSHDYIIPTIARSVQQTTDGGYIFTGDIYTSDTSYDILLVKTDGNGNKIWNKTFGGTGIDHGKDVHQTKDGGYIVIGYTYIDMNPYENYDAILIKTDSNGNKLWSRTFGEGFNANDVQQTKDGGFIIAGYSDSFNHAWLIKTDNYGNKVWDKKFGTKESIFYSVLQTIDGGYITVGSITIVAFTESNSILIKTDGNGNKLWDIKLSGGGQSVGHTKDGGYVVAGGNQYAWLAKIGEKTIAVNLLKNPGFETSYGSVPMYWSKFRTGTKAIFTYPETGKSGKSVAIKYTTKETGKVALWQQPGIVVSPSSQYKLSGYMKLQGVTGSGATPRPGGASLRVSWYKSDGGLIRTDYINKKGTIGWAKYEKIITAPSNAVKATVAGDLFDSAGKVWFDDLSFVKIS